MTVIAIGRSAFAILIKEGRLSSTNNGSIVIALKAPYDQSTVHLGLNPVEVIGHLAAQAPKPWDDLEPSHGLFSPKGKLHGFVVAHNR